MLTQEIREALKNVDESTVLCTEELVHMRRPGKQKVSIINTDANRDMNCMFPLERLRELAAAGVIKEVAPTHFGFMGGGGDVKGLAEVTGPDIARQLQAEHVDAVLMTTG